MFSLRSGLLLLGISARCLADQFSERLSQELNAVQLKPGQKTPMQVEAAAVDRSQWTATASDQQNINPASAAIDGNSSTFWHSQYNPNLALPHSITIDMKTVSNLNGVVLTPRQDGNSTGNIGQHTIELSTDGNTWTTIALGLFIDDSSAKTIPFKTTSARYIKITATTEAGNRGSWTSLADISVTTGSLTTQSVSVAGDFGPTINFPITPVSAALTGDNGKLLLWSAYLPNQFIGSTTNQTYTTTYDPSSAAVSEQLVTAGHDMFCPGISLDAQGNIFVTGGNNAPATSKYTLSSSSWARVADMTIGRGYQSQATLSDGRIFTIGGSWAGGLGGKNGEVYDPSANTWTALSGAPVAPMLTADSQGIYRQDNHAWLFAWKNSYVFQAGPSKAMNWYRIVGSASQAGAGNRASDADAMCGKAVMYDAVAGKILAVGGAPDYQNKPATTNANIITIGTPPNTPSVQQVASMQYARSFANGIALPDGKVWIVGGQSTPVPFSDDTAQLTPELFDPATGKWTTTTAIATPRVYHSVALLMPDATVFVGGGGLCGNCATNHPDGQIWSPPYLFTSGGTRATRPVIKSVTATSVKVGGTFGVTTDSAVTKFSLHRYSSVTHTIDTDQRRIPLTATASSSNSYGLQLPNDAGVVVPGRYMVFALSSAGVPSVAKTILVTL